MENKRKDSIMAVAGYFVSAGIALKIAEKMTKMIIGDKTWGRIFVGSVIEGILQVCVCYTAMYGAMRWYVSRHPSS